MKINKLKLFFKDALKSIRRNITISIASISTLLVTLFILELFFLLLWNIKMEVAGVDPELQIHVFLKNNIKITQQQKIYNKIKSIKGVSNVTFRSKKQALTYLKKQLGDKVKYALNDSQNNNSFLESYYIVKVNKSEDVPIISTQINGLKGIGEIDKNEALAEKTSLIIKAIKWIGVPLFVIFAAVSLFLISNTITLAIYSRREEISVMKCLGATDWFIRWPFIFQGMIIGFLGSAASVIAIFFLYSFLYRKVAFYSVEIFMNLVKPYFVLTAMSWCVMLIGTIIGAVISIFAIRKFLIV